jgi:hypothetical protein
VNITKVNRENSNKVIPEAENEETNPNEEDLHTKLAEDHAQKLLEQTPSE